MDQNEKVLTSQETSEELKKLGGELEEMEKTEGEFGEVDETEGTLSDEAANDVAGGSYHIPSTETKSKVYTVPMVTTRSPQQSTPKPRPITFRA